MKLIRVFYSIIALIFLLPLLCVPAFPTHLWQMQLFNFLTLEHHILIGTKGPLPFFTIIVSLYMTFITFLLCCWGLFKFIQKFGLSTPQFQSTIYHHFFESSLEKNWEKRWLKTSLRKKIFTSMAFLICFLMGIFHFILEDISSSSRSSRGALISWSYNYKFGVMFWEMAISFFTVFPIFYFLILVIYVINIARGMGRGIDTAQPVVQKMRRHKRAKAKKNVMISYKLSMIWISLLLFNPYGGLKESS